MFCFDTKTTRKSGFLILKGIRSSYAMNREIVIEH
jgi:hypothetical protein